MPLRFGRTAKVTPDQLDATPREPLAPDVEALEIRLPDLSRVALEPGDAIAVRLRRDFITAADADRIRRRISDRLPGHEVLVLGGDVELVVLRPVANDLRRRYEAALRDQPFPTILPPATKHVPDAAGLRGRIVCLIAEIYQAPGESPSIPEVALGNEIWHTVVAHLAEHGVELGLPREVEQSVRWKLKHR